MSLTVSVEISGDAAVISGLKKLGESLVMMDQAMQDIGKELTSYFSGQAFASQGEVFGEVWQALSQKYQIYKATGHTTLDPSRWRKTIDTNTFPGRGPLVRTGAMQQGFDFEADSQGVVIYNNVEYFAYHQSDQERSSGLPRRVMMAVNDDVRDIIRHIIDTDIESKIRNAGL